MGHKIGVDPPNFAGVHVSDLKEVVDTRVTGGTTAMDDMTHPPVLVVFLSRQEIMPDDHRHPWCNVQEELFFWLR